MSSDAAACGLLRSRSRGEGHPDMTSDEAHDYAMRTLAEMMLTLRCAPLPPRQFSDT